MVQGASTDKILGYAVQCYRFFSIFCDGAYCFPASYSRHCGFNAMSSVEKRTWGSVVLCAVSRTCSHYSYRPLAPYTIVLLFAAAVVCIVLAVLCRAHDASHGADSCRGVFSSYYGHSFHHGRRRGHDLRNHQAALITCPLSWTASGW